MNLVKEKERTYSDLSILRQDLSLMDVKETPVLSLRDIQLTTLGTAVVGGKEEFALTKDSIKEILNRAGLNARCYQSFFDEALEDVIVKAANEFYRKSTYSVVPVKIITRANPNGHRVVLGLVSERYTLFTHEQVVDQIVKNLDPGMIMLRAQLFPTYLNMGFYNPIRQTKDKVGEVVAVGLNFSNSQGTRTTSLSTSASSLKLICLNGAIAASSKFSFSHPHIGGNMLGQYFRQESEKILNIFSDLMIKLPRLGEMPITEKVIDDVRPELVEGMGLADSMAYIETLRVPGKTIMNLWDDITQLPHKVKNTRVKMRLEQAGFRMLEQYLN